MRHSIKGLSMMWPVSRAAVAGATALSLFAVPALIALGCSDGGSKYFPPPANPAVSTGTVAGTITNADTTQPAAGMVVFIEGIPTEQVTAADGSFTFTGVTVPYTITFLNPIGGGFSAYTYVGVSRADWTGVGREFGWFSTYSAADVSTVTGNVLGATGSIVQVDTGGVLGTAPDPIGDPAYSLPIVPSTPFTVSAIVSGGGMTVDGGFAFGGPVAPGGTVTLDVTLAGSVVTPASAVFTLSPVFASEIVSAGLDAETANGILQIGGGPVTGSGASRTYAAAHPPTAPLGGVRLFAVASSNLAAPPFFEVRRPYTEGSPLPALQSYDPPLVTAPTAPGTGWLSARTVNWTPPPVLAPNYYRVGLFTPARTWFVHVPGGTTTTTLPSLPASVASLDFTSGGAPITIYMGAVRSAGWVGMDSVNTFTTRYVDEDRTTSSIVINP